MTDILITSFCTFLSIIFFINSKKIANVLNLYDIPNERKIHQTVPGEHYSTNNYLFYILSNLFNKFGIIIH